MLVATRLQVIRGHLAAAARQIRGLVDPAQARTAVLNQVPALEGLQALPGHRHGGDAALVDAIRRNAPWAADHLEAVSIACASPETARLAEQANENPPVLRTHDRFGNRIDTVEFHPAYHNVMKLGIEEAKMPSFSWINAHRAGSVTARCAVSYLLYQVESGTQCPQTMTFAAVASIAAHLTAAQRDTVDWVAKLTAGVYDPRDLPVTAKRGVTLGMSMTERQGGSDVRANITTAQPCDPGVEGPGAAYLLNGHKWFTSAPMSDAFLTLAHTETGLSCFIVPRWNWRTSERNTGLVFNRLKNKLGDRSNASSEIEYHNAWGEMLGEPGRGIQTILKMVHHTRLDCIVASAGLMRRCTAEAVHHASNREAFGQRLADSPIMKNVLADLLVESEAATTLAFRIAESFDRQDDPSQAAFGRIGTAVAKYHVCKRAPQLAYEAMECLGGNGYIEDGPMARLFRQSPLNAIWEGSGNVICMDVIRACKTPGALDALRAEIAAADGLDPTLDAFAASIPDPDAGNARVVVSSLALALQASLLLRRSHPAVARAFCASRLATGPRSEYGTLPADTDFDAIIVRGAPNRVLPFTSS